MSEKILETMKTVTEQTKREINKHCVETAIAATKRAAEFRIREIDSAVERYLELLPAELKQAKLKDCVGF